MVVTWRAAVLAGLGVLVVVALPTWWIVPVVTAVLVAVLVVDMLLAAPPSRVTARRGGTSSIRLGTSASTHVLLANPTGRTVRRALVRDAWPPSAGATGTVWRVDLPPGQRRRHETLLQPTRRGDRHAGPVVVRTMGPLGFAGRQYEHPARWRVRVLPPFESRRHLPAMIARLRELEGRVTIRTFGQGSEFDSLREYVPGDDVRTIDWRGTARASTVMVRTWRPERDRHVLIVLDSGRSGAGRVGDQPKLDHAMDGALLLAALAARAGDRVDLMIVDRTVRASVVKASPSEMLNRFVEAMAPIEPVLAETDHVLLVTQALTRVAQRSLVVILTGLDAVSVTEGLIPSLGPLLRRHDVVVAAVSDPRLDELAAAHETASDAYAAAAAEAEAERRQQTAETLQRLGVSVLQAPPATFAPQLCRRYLAINLGIGSG